MSTISTKSDGDTFAASDLNTLISALRNAVGVTDSDQRYINPDEIRIADAATKVWADSLGNLSAADVKAGTVTLSQMGGAQTPTPLTLGLSFVPDVAAVGVSAGTIYLRGVTVPRDSVAATGIRFHAANPGGSLITGIYDSGGTLLASSPAAAIAAGDVTHAWDTPAVLNRGNYWLAALGTGSLASNRPLCDTDTKGLSATSFALPGTIGVPSGFTIPIPPLFGIVSGGLSF